MDGTSLLAVPGIGVAVTGLLVIVIAEVVGVTVVLVGDISSENIKLK